MYKHSKEIIVADRLMEGLSPDELKQFKYLGTSENKKFYNIPSKHAAAICPIVPNRKPTQEEWVQLHRDLAEIVYKASLEKRRIVI